MLDKIRQLTDFGVKVIDYRSESTTRNTIAKIVKEEVRKLNEDTDKVAYLFQFKPGYVIVTNKGDIPAARQLALLTMAERNELAKYAAVDKIAGLGKMSEIPTSLMVKNKAFQSSFDFLKKYVKSLTKIRIYR